MKRLVRGGGTGLWILLAALGCGGHAGEGVQIGGETNWLATCSVDSDCSVGQCLCGVCTISCAEDAACSDGPTASSCVRQSELPASCGQQLAAGLCLASDTQVGGILSSAELPEPATPLDAMLGLLLRDLEAQPLEAQPFTRYLSLANLREAKGLGPDEAEGSLDALLAAQLTTEQKLQLRLQRGQQAVARLVNSVSLRAALSVPVLIDAEGIYQRIDIRSYGWDRPVLVDGLEYADGWEAIVARSSLALEYRGVAAEQLLVRSGTRFSWLFADDLSSTATDSKTYAALLGLPEHLGQLQASLASAADVTLSAQRAAFENSGVSYAPRVVERRLLGGDRAVWQAFDFASEEQGSAAFSNPLGFVPDQTEVIFPLPNGLQAFFLADSAGQRLEESNVPREILLDPGQLDGQLRSPASCFSCHAGGLIHFNDVMHDTWLPAGDEERLERPTVLDTYPPAEVLQAIVTADNQVWADAIAGLGFDDPYRTSSSSTTRLLALFRGEVDTVRAAAELFTTRRELQLAVPRLPRSLFPLLWEEGEVPRVAFIEAYRDALCTLHPTAQNKPLGCQ